MVAKGVLRTVGRAGGSRYILSENVLLQAGSEAVRSDARRREVLLTAIRDRGKLTSTEAAEQLGTSILAARQLLNEMADAGLIRAAGRTRGRRYFLA